MKGKWTGGVSPFHLPSSMREAHHMSEDYHASYHQAVGGDLVNEGEYTWVPSQGGNENSSQSPITYPDPESREP